MVSCCGEEYYFIYEIVLKNTWMANTAFTIGGVLRESIYRRPTVESGVWAVQ